MQHGLQRRVLQLALEARICVNSARKALREGADALRGDAGVRAAEVMKRHGWEPAAVGKVLPPNAANG